MLLGKLVDVLRVEEACKTETGRVLKDKQQLWTVSQGWKECLNWLMDHINGRKPSESKIE